MCVGVEGFSPCSKVETDNVRTIARRPTDKPGETGVTSHVPPTGPQDLLCLARYGAVVPGAESIVRLS